MSAQMPAVNEAELENTDKAALEDARKYEAELKKADNEILDARMEYGHLMSNYMTLVNMFWVGYGAFFTINSLFATALGISYSDNAKGMDKRFLYLIHVLIPLTGIFISACAIYAAVKIADSERLIQERGRELESTVLRAAIFRGLQERGTPVWTIIGALFFAILWASSFLAVGKWPPS
jgi:hypothetical protein